MKEKETVMMMFAAWHCVVDADNEDDLVWN
jgi:hypothetical protein